MDINQILPNEPDEVPVIPEKPEINKPWDPGVPSPAPETPGTQPPEITPDRPHQPEIRPERING
jgi:hypothetical protein